MAQSSLPKKDPLHEGYPEVIEEYLEHGVMKCIAFNHRGTLLAAGCSDGSCVIWDFLTRGVAKVLKDNNCDAAITSVSWSKLGHRLLVAAVDNSLTVWDVLQGHKVGQVITLQKIPFRARLNPGSSIPSMCLVCPLSTPPMIVDLNSGSTTTLPISLPGTNSPILPHSASVACFNKYGDLVYVGNCKGEILVIDHKSNQVCAIAPTFGGSMIRGIVFSRNGKFLLTNSTDQTIRIYENLLSSRDGLKSLNDLKETLKALSGTELLRAIGSKCLMPLREFKGSVTRMHWKASCFSGDSEWVLGGSADRDEHKMYIWDREGNLVKILQGPKESVLDLAWHPTRPMILSVSATGRIYIWAKDYTENWSAFFPDFIELEENEVYVEREDEFDIFPVNGKQSPVNEDDEVDIMTVDKDTFFSDSDLSQEELLYLPVKICPDVPDKQDESIVHEENILHESPPSEIRFTSYPLYGQGSAIDNSNSRSAIDDSNSGGTSLRRKRKPTAKALELQKEKNKKAEASQIREEKKSRK